MWFHSARRWMIHEQTNPMTPETTADTTADTRAESSIVEEVNVPPLFTRHIGSEPGAPVTNRVR
jgi:hypothetical protein